MGWEARGERFFYYRPRRAGGRVVRDYHGAGPAAQLAADLVDEARDRRAAAAKAHREDQARLRHLTALMEQLNAPQGTPLRGCHVNDAIRVRSQMEGRPPPRNGETSQAYGATG